MAGEAGRCSSPGCTEPAITVLRGTGERLCARHFTASVEGRVRETVEGRGMVQDDDVVVVGLSGGKDSTVLLHVLSRILRGRPVRVVAVTVDEGIAGYREETVQTARAITAACGVEHVIVSFEDFCGSTLDTLVRDLPLHPCTICGVLRRRLLQNAARDLGATRLATGHCLDDEVQSALMNILNGDVRRIMRTGVPDTGAFVPRIKPLRNIPEKEVTMYGIVQGIYTPLPECPYAGEALRSDVRHLLSTLEYRHPGTMVRLMEGYDRLRERVGGCVEAEGVSYCPDCGEPSTGGLCRACELLRDLRTR
ncbi:MAG: TIGR00269 family protein [Methanofollis sp.]|uniref:TIGR00269 family protein n=1 Tax=Methanofollis sp. TaxID=2052835 RepID=UPI0026161ECE|nr:TIGR00269 family protein [Methanofollis sp.]MDD4254671.1 TIGR00269 family protein [Methanofollis sp.]